MIRFLHLNVEHNKYFEERARFFIEKIQPEVLCLQEFPQTDVGKFERLFGVESFYVPMTRKGEEVYGLCILSAFPILNRYEERYGGSDEKIPAYDGASVGAVHMSVRFSLAVCDVEKDGKVFRIGTTHFPVTVRGQATDFQREDMKRLLILLKRQGELVFSGDFNAPRGGEIFSMLAKCYTDNVPEVYKTSLDQVLHQAVKHRPHELVDKMVDGLFNTPGYIVSGVEMPCGVSDHCALTAQIAKNS